MNACLTEQELTLLHYGELPADSIQSEHITTCSRCQEKLAQLSSELRALPQLNYTEHPAVATRMAARVNERLQRPRRRWVPALSALAVSACALVATIMIWNPQQQNMQQRSQVTSAQTPLVSIEDEMPAVDFLEEMDLLMELDLLSQVEGV